LSHRPGSETRTRVWAVDDGGTARRSDRLATEEPMEIRLLFGDRTEPLAVTMRTPGNDFELAAGFLHSEGVVAAPADVRGISYCVDRDLDAAQLYNIVNVKLAPGAVPELRSLERHFFTSSSCGVCGKASIESLRLRNCPVIPPGPQVDPALLTELPDKLRVGQGVFRSTGGLHAAGLFDGGGELVAVREDVGRHNALDKLIGWALMNDRLPLTDHIVLVSGRASFEIMQKALMAGIPIVCAVSAPSSLAVDVAQDFGMTLIGFLRDERFNVYAGRERVLFD
jgi:FdhD protein